MANMPSYTLSNESLTVIWEGRPYTVQRGSPNYTALRRAILEEDAEAIPRNLTISSSLQDWATGEFGLDAGSNFTYKGDQVPHDLNRRMVEMANRGENPTPLFNFYERLQKNPSFRSVQQLFPFLKHQGIPLTEDGCFLAYKSVNSDYTDKHSGKFDNHPGVINQMDRNKVSDDPKVPCHEGFHVGALAYVQSFGGARIVICKVDPADVVCVPFDESQHKMRVCRYKVIGQYSGQLMPSTVILDKDLPDHGKSYPEERVNEIDTSAPEEQEVNIEDETEEVESPEAANERTVDEQSELERLAEADEQGLNEEEIPGVKSRSGDPKRHSKKGWTKFDKMDMQSLMKQSLEDLRQYAGKGLEIVGASKIPGGKTALVGKILEIRA